MPLGLHGGRGELSGLLNRPLQLQQHGHLLRPLQLAALDPFPSAAGHLNGPLVIV